MMWMEERQAIPRKIAIDICEEIQGDLRKKGISYQRIYCYFCKKSKIFGNDMNRGCRIVNLHFDKRITGEALLNSSI